MAAPGEGGGALAGTPTSGTPTAPGETGGAAYGEAPAAKPRPKRKAKRRAQPTSALTAPHRFPVAGAFGWGGPDARFGAKRKGHRHQGQDLAAASGTPVVAPYRGVVVAVQYQAEGAGRYVVIDGEDYDYVFMHLRTGSVVVAEGIARQVLAQIAPRFNIPDPLVPLLARPFDELRGSVATSTDGMKGKFSLTLD